MGKFPVLKELAEHWINAYSGDTIYPDSNILTAEYVNKLGKELKIFIDENDQDHIVEINKNVETCKEKPENLTRSENMLNKSDNINTLEIPFDPEWLNDPEKLQAYYEAVIVDHVKRNKELERQNSDLQKHNTKILLRARDAEKFSKWQPIDTAPKDCTTLLLWDESYEYGAGVGYYSHVYEKFMVGNNKQPSLWMPIKQPTKEEKNVMD